MQLIIACSSVILSINLIYVNYEVRSGSDSFNWRLKLAMKLRLEQTFPKY